MGIALTIIGILGISLCFAIWCCIRVGDTDDNDD